MISRAVTSTRSTGTSCDWTTPPRCTRGTGGITSAISCCWARLRRPRRTSNRNGGRLARETLSRLHERGDRTTERAGQEDASRRLELVRRHGALAHLAARGAGLLEHKRAGDAGETSRVEAGSNEYVADLEED